MLEDLGISRGQAVRFALLPQIFPRLKKLLGGSLFGLPYLLLQVFTTVKIIPLTHPALRYENRGKYSLLQVLALAANQLEFKRSNLDKLTIFTVILGGIAMFFLQVLLLILALLTKPALAYNGPGLGPRSLSDFFSNANNEHDIAFRLLDLIFGIPGIFQSSAITSGEVPTPFHEGMHALFGFYSYGMLLVGTFIIIYLVTSIVLETAESGIPFGQRFNKAWVPVRLVLFFGLLLPTSNGINLAQYVLLNAAKYGSNLATNGWMLFDETTRKAYIPAEQLIATPTAPDVVDVAAFMSLVKTCSWAEGQVNGRDIQPYFVFGPRTDPSEFHFGDDNSIQMAGVEGEDSSLPFSEMVEKSAGKTMYFRFGEKDLERYANETGGVRPYCGELSLTIVDQGQPGAAFMQKAYVGMLMCLWEGRTSTEFKCDTPGFDEMAKAFTQTYAPMLGGDAPADLSEYVSNDKRMEIIASLNRTLITSVKDAVQRQADQGEWGNDPAAQLGWGGAGIWFNKIAEQNGALTSAVFAEPEIKSMPLIMEYIRAQNQQAQRNVSADEMYTPILTGDHAFQFNPPEDRIVALVLNKVYKYWGSGDTKVTYRPSTSSESGAANTSPPPIEERQLTGNVMIDFFNMFMGTGGLFDICKNADVHPLAAMSSLGKGLIEHSIRSYVVTIAFGALGGIASLFEQTRAFSKAAQAFASFFSTFAGIGLLLGFLLFYVVPFMPFIYFFFAVMTWVKGIFEAMVGMPLWALAHLRIEGEGMPGPAAAEGYFYILEAFLRPILILISFLGSVIIFTAMVKVLNEVFYLVLANLSGHHAIASAGCFNPPAGTTISDSAKTVINAQDFQRGTIDQFFYTVVYTIIVYMIAGPCFKLVDLIPDRVTRWMGLGISTFGAQDGDPAGQLISQVSQGVGLLGAKMQGLFRL